MKQVNVRFREDEVIEIDALRAALLPDLPTRPEAVRALVGVALALLRGDKTARLSRDRVVVLSAPEFGPLPEASANKSPWVGL